MKTRLSILLSLLIMTSVCSCSKRSAPLIGISCGRSATGAVNLSSAYTDAIARAGGIPVVLPIIDDEALAGSLLAKLDGIVFSGGPDVDPAEYGEEVWNETVGVDAVRDRSDLLFARAALASGKPVLAICRGEQLMNVVLGGTLYQDIPTQVDTMIKHSGFDHRIGVEKGSVLYDLFGQDSLTVNSSHHQAVKDPAPASASPPTPPTASSRPMSMKTSWPSSSIQRGWSRKTTLGSPCSAVSSTVRDSPGLGV